MRILNKEIRKMRKMAGYYATEAGRDEVARGCHDEALEVGGSSRDQWLKEWDERNVKYKEILSIKLNNLNQSATTNGH
ncbi:hypothetical protein OQJ65_17155 [Vibrio sp. Sgm 22]|uniref:hypothetical protein n=1 Tax=unclassified Vibrio TaxID=2614977 RepID=UPI002249895B|nr:MULTISPECIES: hypothetical protein [unclassified Vibrio]MCX2777052.1 hypothetical protein [Vibrio sp. Sgm 22]